MTPLTPKEIVFELDRHIVGQKEAKRAVAIALRNRWRRLQLSEDLKEEVLPKNILMIGPTGVGKTEIARRLAKLAQAPFLKVEATKFTEIGYVGRDVEQIIRDLLDVSLHLTRERLRKDVQPKAEKNATERILDALVGETATLETRQKFRALFEAHELDHKEIDVQVLDTASSPLSALDVPGLPGTQMGMLNLGEIFGKAMGGPPKKSKRVNVSEAFRLFCLEESDKLLDPETTTREAIFLVEQNGIVFLDEIDKICAKNSHRQAEVSREGVQRDLLPLIEGTTVSTKHGSVRTDHILFIASGAFHVASPSDLLPELQGRLPIRVELKALTQKDFVSILTEPETNLIRQSKALLATESVDLSFTEEAIEEIARLAAQLNQEVENIGARRLHTILEKLLEEVSFHAPDMPNQAICLSGENVRKSVGELAKNTDLSKFIL